MRLPVSTHARLARYGELPDERINLMETALVLASIERPGTPIDPYIRHMERLCDEVHTYVQDGPVISLDFKIEALCQIIAKRYGYIGIHQSYENPDDTNLMRVIDHRNGSPVALGIIYMHVARKMGWTVTGLDFPARFLIRLEDDGERAILDPYAGGRKITSKDMREISKAVQGNQAELTPSQYCPLDNRGILLRLQNHIKSRMIRSGQIEEALGAIEIMLLFAPNASALWREAGLLNVRLDNVREAVAALEKYLRYNPADSTRYRTSILLQELRGRLN